MGVAQKRPGNKSGGGGGCGGGGAGGEGGGGGGGAEGGGGGGGGGGGSGLEAWLGEKVWLDDSHTPRPRGDIRGHPSSQGPSTILQKEVQRGTAPCAR